MKGKPYPIAPITDFVLSEHTNNLYKKVANSSIDLAKTCAEKINEIIASFNELAKEKWEKIHEQDGKLRSFELYIKDNLTNYLYRLFNNMKLSGELVDIITQAVLNDVYVAMQRVENEVSVKEFGAVGNGYQDDTDAIQNAINSGKTITIPKGTFIVSKTINIPAETILKGSGRDTIIKMKQATGDDINSVILMNGDHGSIEDLSIDGSDVVNGIAFSKNTYHFSVKNVMINNCLKGVYDYESLWMGEFTNVHLKSCLEGFSLANNISKTSLTFKNCWCENCGAPYDFYRVDYSSLINCGADFCNYLTDSPYTKGYGDESDRRGVYNFSLCKGLSMVSCGSENSYGNGLIKMSASSVVVNGLVATNIKSKFEPNYSTYPNYKVGDILLTAEKNKLILNGYCFNSRFENTYVKNLKPNDVQPIIAYNYSESSYGRQEHKSVIVSGLQDLGNVVFDGMGDYKHDCVNLDDNLVNMKVESLTINNQKNFGAKKLICSSDSGTGTCLSIPMIANSDYNYSHKLRISGIDASKSNTPHPFFVEVAFASSSSVKQITILNSTDGIEVECIANILQINLPYEYSSIHVECSAISDKIDLIDWDNATLI